MEEMDEAIRNENRGRGDVVLPSLCESQ
jgi:hypothetical protein